MVRNLDPENSTTSSVDLINEVSSPIEETDKQQSGPGDTIHVDNSSLCVDVSTSKSTAGLYAVYS